MTLCFKILPQYVEGIYTLEWCGVMCILKVALATYEEQIIGTHGWQRRDWQGSCSGSTDRWQWVVHERHRDGNRLG